MINNPSRRLLSLRAAVGECFRSSPMPSKADQLSTKNHFSASILSDLHPLEELLRTLRDDGLHGLSVYLERGTF